MPGVTARVLEGFGDAALSPELWASLREHGPTDAVFLAPEWLEPWWETLGRGELLLVAAEREGRVVALAPLFAADGVVALCGAHSSDYLDVLGEVGALQALLAAALEAAPAAERIVLDALPERSPTRAALPRAAAALGLELRHEGSTPTPVLERTGFAAAARRQSLVRHERWFEREGELGVRHLASADEVAPELDAFFEQHVARWRATPHPSLFEDAAQRDFYRRLAGSLAAPGWLRFTRVEWNGRPVAFHFGPSYGGSYLWYKPSFEIDLARRSPGEVLLRHLLLAAEAEGAHTFDFGLGDEAFKYRFATAVPRVDTWSLTLRRP